ncbi:putative Oxidoreductase [Zostera marina]|uniref:Putative Oxidoreductase n=1 Tax=Zostera marina TaxID=29655 RepID=A0A0K9P2V9_ZOSMR|nr:putative Oxidoreductase [Zostera marina]
MEAKNVSIPRIAVLGAGIFVRTQYIPRLRELVNSVVVAAIWSRSEESAKTAVKLAVDFSPNVECKWGDDGLDEIARDDSIDAVAVVLAGQAQVQMSLKMLKAGKHVIQEKPASVANDESEAALSQYKAFCSNALGQPIWAVAENYRFEPAFLEAQKLIKDDIGDLMNVQLIAEGSMNSSNPYFSSSWRRDFDGGFILDMGVHYIAALRMVVGEVSTVSAVSRHVNLELPPPDNLSALFQLENGCAGIFVMTVSSKSPKIYWRIVGSKGTVQVERGNIDGKHGYSVLFWNADGKCQKTFHPFCGVNEELKAFFNDVTQAKWKGAIHKADPRSLFVEGARDIAVLEAMLESSQKQGEQVGVKKF